MLKSIEKIKEKHRYLVGILIAFGIVSFWRGVWGLMDEYLFPHNYQLSVWVSVIIGIVVLVVVNFDVEDLM